MALWVRANMDAEERPQNHHSARGRRGAHGSYLSLVLYLCVMFVDVPLHRQCDMFSVILFDFITFLLR